MVGVAQLVRVPGCGPGGRGFKSPHSPHDKMRSHVKNVTPFLFAHFPFAGRENRGNRYVYKIDDPVSL
jgi:hypothetical protein